jgi:hypothetical protein
LHASLTADADPWIKINNTILPLVHGCDWTYAGARWIGTVITASYLKMTPGIWKDPSLNVFYPGTVDTERYLVFTLTGSRTGVATNTLAIVDDEAVIHKSLLPSVGKENGV